MDLYGNYFFLDDRILTVDHNDKIVSGELSFYEVIRTRRGIPVFFEDHIQRLLSGISTRYKINDDIALKIREGLKTLVRAEAFDEINIRVTVTFTGNIYSLHICYIKSEYPTEEMVREGVQMIMYHAERSDPGVKILNNRLRHSVNSELSEKNAYEAALVNGEGYITEGSRSNLFFVDGSGKIFTAPDRMVLSGVTRKYITEIIINEGLTLVFEPVSETDTGKFRSVFITGTSPMVLPVRSIESQRFDVCNQIVERLRILYISKVEDSLRSYGMKEK